MDNLNDKQIAFCKEYVVDNNAAQAAIRAGYSRDTAKEQGSRLLTKVNIKNYIKKLQNEKSNDLNIKFEDIVEGTFEIATTGERDTDRLKAYELTSKLLGFFEKDNSQKKSEIVWNEVKNYGPDDKTD